MSGDEPAAGHDGDTPAGAASEPDVAERLAAARLAHEESLRADGDAFRAIWSDVLRYPLRNGTFVGVLALAVVAACFSWFEGGKDDGSRGTHLLIQVFFGGIGFLVLAHYARRIVYNTVHGDRPVPWGRDDEDLATLWQNIADLGSIVGVLMLPLGVFLLADAFLDFAGLLRWPVICLLAVAAAAQMPLALAAVTVKDDVVAAFPRTTLRMWRAEPRAARLAAVTAIAFVALIGASFYLAIPFNHGLGPRSVIEDHTTVRDAGRLGLFVLRTAGFYAALVSFRVAGLLVRDVPRVKEILS